MKVKVKIHRKNGFIYVTYAQMPKGRVFIKNETFWQNDVPILQDTVIASNDPAINNVKNVDSGSIYPYAKLSHAFVERMGSEPVEFAIAELNDGTPVVNNMGILPIHRLKTMWDEAEVLVIIQEAFDAGVNFEAGVESTTLLEYSFKTMEKLCLG